MNFRGLFLFLEFKRKMLILSISFIFVSFFCWLIVIGAARGWSNSPQSLSDVVEELREEDGYFRVVGSCDLRGSAQRHIRTLRFHCGCLSRAREENHRGQIRSRFQRRPRH